MTVSVVLDAAGRRRSPATMPGHHAGRPRRNKGPLYPADPRTVEEIVAVMREASDERHGYVPLGRCARSTRPANATDVLNSRGRGCTTSFVNEWLADWRCQVPTERLSAGAAGCRVIAVLSQISSAGVVAH